MMLGRVTRHHSITTKELAGSLTVILRRRGWARV